MGCRLRNAELTVCKGFDGAVAALRDGRELAVRRLDEGEVLLPNGGRQERAATPGTGEGGVAVATGQEPVSDHPWGRGFQPDAAGVAAADAALFRRSHQGYAPPPATRPGLRRRRWPEPPGRCGALVSVSAGRVPREPGVASVTEPTTPLAEGDISELERRGHL